MSSSSKYEVAIAYRIYPKVSKTPFIYPNDKFKLASTGVKTLKKSLGNYRAKVYFLLDNCPPEYVSMILSHFSESDISLINYQGIGNLATFGKQIDLLLRQSDSEIVMFAEDDYVYRKDELQKAISLLKNNPKIDFVTPYDHLDSYTLPIHTKHRYEIIAQEGLHWRTSASTCLTFLTTKSTLKKSEQTFRTYCQGNWDSSLWFALTKFNIFDISSLLLLFNDWFLFKTIAKSWMTCGWQIIFGKKYKL
ncbi:MAG: hypothetical protein K2U26_04300, partial [Cyclobacteriaceae bacterium]|nr:hypothetical protein [Cyclobacteriaceae bacterium]